MSKPIAVLISDVHYKESNIHTADMVYEMALERAEALNVPLIDCGDTLDEKGNIKATCANALIDTLDGAKVPVYILVGNHTLINAKGKEHALKFLRPYANIIQSPVYVPEVESYLLPYYDSADELKSVLAKIPSGSRIIMHQGVQTANMGAYVQDKSSLPPETFADYRVISGHYHQAQDIKCGRPRKGAVGLFSYVGSPFTHSFAEAHDGPKGYQILHDNGLLELVPRNLRRHIIKEVSIEELPSAGEGVRPADLLWIKVRGYKSELDKLKKQDIAKIVGRDSFKLDLIPLDKGLIKDFIKIDKDHPAVLDSLIDNLNEPAEWRAYLKVLWRDIVG